MWAGQIEDRNCPAKGCSCIANLCAFAGNGLVAGNVELAPLDPICQRLYMLAGSIRLHGHQLKLPNSSGLLSSGARGQPMYPSYVASPEVGLL